MEEAQRDTLEIDGSRTAFWTYGRSAGSAQTLVLVHGFRGDHHGLAGLAGALDDFHVIVPDLPGFGASERLPEPHTIDAFARWLHLFTERVAPGQRSMVGHSFGSLVVSAAVAQGLVTDRLTLLNPISTPALRGPRGVLTRGAILYYELGQRLPERLANMLLKNSLIVRGMSETMAKTRDSDLRAWIHAQHDQFFSTFADRQSLLEAFRASVSHTVGEFRSQLTEPTLIVCGDIDDIAPLEGQLRLARSLPQAALRVLPGVGHLLHYEAVRETAALIRAFYADSDEAVMEHSQ